MFDINDYPEILIHIKGLSRIFKKHSSGWYEIFCPYCDDSIRKFSPRHGHFYISPMDLFAHCFRCGNNVGLYRLLEDTNFQNRNLIEYIKKLSNFKYSKTKASKFTKTDISKDKIFAVKTKIISQYKWLEDNHPDLMDQFKDYIFNRCLEIRPTEFFMVPTINNNKLHIRFLNYSGDTVTTKIVKSDKYLINNGKSKYYHFQNIFDIDEYSDIVIAEGTFDIINLYNYYYKFKNSFFLAVGGNNYNGAIIDIVNSYLLIGEYTFHVVFDSDILKRANKVINIILKSINNLNPSIDVNFYYPIVSKDVSEMMLIERIGD